MEEYRGVTLMVMLYKVYTLILAERLEEVVEEKGLFPPNHIRYRKGMGVLDNVYVNYLINRQLSRKRASLTTTFVDLKAAFNSIDKGALIEAMKRRGIRGRLITRVEELLRETQSRVKVGEDMNEKF